MAHLTAGSATAKSSLDQLSTASQSQHQPESNRRSMGSWCGLELSAITRPCTEQSPSRLDWNQLTDQPEQPPENNRQQQRCRPAMNIRSWRPSPSRRDGHVDRGGKGNRKRQPPPCRLHCTAKSSARGRSPAASALSMFWVSRTLNRPIGMMTPSQGRSCCRLPNSRVGTSADANPQDQVDDSKPTHPYPGGRHRSQDNADNNGEQSPGIGNRTLP